jgi:hypothetical protein
MRVRASRPPIQIRLLDGRTITLYTFDEEYDAPLTCGIRSMTRACWILAVSAMPG